MVVLPENDAFDDTVEKMLTLLLLLPPLTLTFLVLVGVGVGVALFRFFLFLHFLFLFCFVFVVIIVSVVFKLLAIDLIWSVDTVLVLTMLSVLVFNSFDTFIIVVGVVFADTTVVCFNTVDCSFNAGLSVVVVVTATAPLSNTAGASVTTSVIVFSVEESISD